MGEDSANLSRTPAIEPQTPARRFNGFRGLMAFCCGLTCIAGLSLRWTVRDGLPSLAVLYYALPIPVLAGLAGLTGIALRGCRRRLPGRVVWAVTALLIAVGIYSGYSHRQQAAPDDTLDLVFWNTARGARGWNEIAAEIHRHDAPVVGLVEAGVDSDEMHDFWTSEFPDRDVAVLGHGMILLVQGRILLTSTGSLGTDSDYARVDVRVNNHELTIVLVDIVSTPWKPRGQSLDDLAVLVESLSDRRVIVMGDFNTPPESVHFDRLRRTCRNAFESAGTGYAATWPVPLPVLSLDQMWATDKVTIHGCRHLWSTRSDHRPVRTTISIR